MGIKMKKTVGVFYIEMLLVCIFFFLFFILFFFYLKFFFWFFVFCFLFFIFYFLFFILFLFSSLLSLLIFSRLSFTQLTFFFFFLPLLSDCNARSGFISGFRYNYSMDGSSGTPCWFLG